MIGDRLEKGYRTGQIKGKDYLYVTGTPGMGSSGNPSLTNYRYIWWAIKAHPLAVLNTKIELLNINFELYDQYPSITHPNPNKLPYRLLLSSKHPINDVLDYSAVKFNQYVSAGSGLNKTYVAAELDLPQPVEPGYDGKIYAIIDMLSTNKAPIYDMMAIQVNDGHYEAMDTRVYDYEARL